MQGRAAMHILRMVVVSWFTINFGWRKKKLLVFEYTAHRKKLIIIICGMDQQRPNSAMASNDPADAEPSADPVPGDLIEIFRSGYQHWALYLGDGLVINLTPVDRHGSILSNMKLVLSRRGVVCVQPLEEVVRKCRYRINNKYDNHHAPLPTAEILQRAKFYVGKKVYYDLLGQNCEHFVTLLRYGEGVSDQASRAIGAITLVMVAATGLILLGLINRGFRNRSF